MVAKLFRFFTGLPLKARTYTNIYITKNSVTKAIQLLTSKHLRETAITDLGVDDFLVPNVDISNKHLKQNIKGKNKNFERESERDRQTDRHTGRQKVPEKPQQAAHLVIVALNATVYPKA